MLEIGVVSMDGKNDMDGLDDRCDGLLNDGYGRGRFPMDGLSE